MCLLNAKKEVIQCKLKLATKLPKSIKKNHLYKGSKQVVDHLDQSSEKIAMNRYY